MKKLLPVLAALFICTTLVVAQKREESLDYRLKPVRGAAYYYAVTEKKDSGWHRQVWYMAERTMAMEGWYKDSDCLVAHGTVSWYHPNRFLKSQGIYVDGKKEGSWLQYHEKGRLKDSAFYVQGRQQGIGLGWDEEGYQTDSSNFDAKGNGVQVAWFKEGGLRFSGRWIQDTLKQGRWQYFHDNGKLMATEDYVAGELTTNACYTETGDALGAKECELKEAAFPGGDKAWRLFLENNLDAAAPIKGGAPNGQFTAMIQFIVDKDGSLYDMKGLTKYGYGMEAEVIRLLKRSPKWQPAQQHGRKVKAYRLQPVTFVVSGK